MAREWAPAAVVRPDTAGNHDEASPSVVPGLGGVQVHHPPLDGTWATAPFLHNGSVPTLEAVLDSGRRPPVWRRVDLDSTTFDEDAVGWPYEELSVPQAELPVEEQPMVYDTSYGSQSNAGHLFGDALTDDERHTVIDYLKTL